jgi:hypothetical protein
MGVHLSTCSTTPAGLAYYILKLDNDVVSEVRDLTADERARFERIRDTHPDFAEEQQ